MSTSNSRTPPAETDYSIVEVSHPTYSKPADDGSGSDTGQFPTDYWVKDHPLKGPIFKMPVTDPGELPTDSLTQLARDLFSAPYPSGGWLWPDPEEGISGEDYEKAKQKLIEQSTLYTPPKAEVESFFPDSDWE